MVAYQDLHRYCLQSFMSKSFMTEKKARELYSRACTKYSVEHRAEDFRPFLAAINKKLEPFYMEIRHGKSEDEGVSYYALVNCSEDEHSKVATDLTANEIAFFKKVVDLIVTSDDGYMPAMTLVNTGMELETRMTASTSETLLTKLTQGKWLTEISGDYSLGPRTIIELSMYLKNIYQEEIPDCKMCMHIVVKKSEEGSTYRIHSRGKGQTCANCGVRIHLYCANTFFKGRPAESRKCPGCQAQWLHGVPNINALEIEDDVMDIDDTSQSQLQQQPQPQPQSSTSSRKRSSRTGRR